MQEEKKKMTLMMVSYRNQPRSLTKELLGWSRDSLAFYLVSWLALCLFKIADFEEDALAIKA